MRERERERERINALYLQPFHGVGVEGGYQNNCRNCPKNGKICFAMQYCVFPTDNFVPRSGIIKIIWHK